MSFWRWFGGIFSRKRLDKGSHFHTHTEIATASGSVVNADTALKLSAVWACVRLRSQTIASLPLHLFRKDKTIASDHYLYRILHDSPNADMTASEFWESMVLSLDLWGNAYALIHRHEKTRRVIALDVLNPEYMTIFREKDGTIIFHYQENNKIFHYSADDILHIKGMTIDGLVGLSPIQYQAKTLGFQIDANQASHTEFKNQLKAGGFLKTESLLTEEQRNRLRGALDEFSQPEKAGKYMVLEAGLDVVSGLRINPKDAQLLESRYFGIEEICRTFGVPPQLIYHMDKASSWASSLEGMNTGFLMYSLRPVLVRIEQTIVKKLLNVVERGDYKPRFAVEGLLRADSQGRATFYTSALQNGWMTRNEVRELEDLPPLAGGDVLTVQLNLTPLENLGKTNE